MWQGLLRNRCFSSIPGNESLFYTPPNGDFVCSTTSGMQTCQDIPSVHNTHNFSLCLQSGTNPFLNSISFDNIAYALIAVFQVVTLESWTSILFLVQDVHSYWTWLYFVTLIQVAHYFKNILLLLDVENSNSFMLRVHHKFMHKLDEAKIKKLLHISFFQS